MQEDSKENQGQSSIPLNLTPDDKRNLVGFFELLLKVDKRVNPALYQIKSSENDRHSMPLNPKE